MEDGLEAKVLSLTASESSSKRAALMFTFVWTHDDDIKEYPRKRSDFYFYYFLFLINRFCLPNGNIVSAFALTLDTSNLPHRGFTSLGVCTYFILYVVAVTPKKDNNNNHRHVRLRSFSLSRVHSTQKGTTTLCVQRRSMTFPNLISYFLFCFYQFFGHVDVDVES